MQPIGALAVQAGLISPQQLDDALRAQESKHAKGEFVRLGELLVDRYGRACPAESIRALLSEQGIELVACQLCGTRFNALRTQGRARCLRCGQPLHACPAGAPLTVEDTLTDPGPEMQALLGAYHQRNPARVGRYLILGEVGRGAAGIIYKAWVQDRGGYVALKFLRNASALAYEDRLRFKREAEHLIRLRHECIVAAHAIEEQGDLSFIVMEFLQGVPLDVLIRKGQVTRGALLAMGAKLARTLEFTHQAGLVHRDIKAANVVVDGSGAPFLVDFGIAKNALESMSLTNEGEVLGSLAYMDPEYLQSGQKALDLQCDLYGLGVVLYEGLSGTYPYGDPSYEDMVVRILKQEPLPLGQVAPQVPPQVAAVVDKAVAKSRAARYPTAAALAEALEALLGPDTS